MTHALAMPLLLVVLGSINASADDHAETEAASNGVFVVGAKVPAAPTAGGASIPTNAAISSSSGSWTRVGAACSLGGGVTCQAAVRCDDGSPAIEWAYVVDGVAVETRNVCPTDAAPGPVPSASPAPPDPGAVASAFAQVAPPQVAVRVQPPGGETLVNFPTVLSATADPYDAEVVVLDQQVTLHIRPVRFTWSHGDGTKQVTDHPGRAWVEGDDALELIHHVFTEPSDLSDPGDKRPISLTTTWAATWTWQGQDMGAVTGTVESVGPEAAYTVLQARPTLVR